MEPNAITPKILLPESAPVTDEDLEELSEEEAALRHRLELKVERALFQASVALRELQQRQLHRSTHRQFDHYCQERFGFDYSDSPTPGWG